ncbi:MAG: Ppx/GppA phosphatase family protein [Lautropia sp.]|nr:Ppx/GppA phosphatase family protein [Lautropia sp.]
MSDPAVRRPLAAIDLGSNSFRLLIAEIDDSSAGPQLRILDQIKETVRLGAGLDQNFELSEEAQQRALQALGRFAERLDGLKLESFRAVATNTFRVARNAGSFLVQARAVLGRTIEVVAGREEARLIYVGAAHSLPRDGKRRLVVDIGGGSTECILGIDERAQRRESLQIGSVALTQQFFGQGKVTRGLMRRARLHCGERLASHVRAFQSMGWEYAVGTSGTAKALWQILEATLGHAEITRAGLAELEDRCVAAGHVNQLDLPGLKADRRPVIAGGLAAMQAIFDEFGIESMSYCEGALREGILYDLLGRESGSDQREITISHLVERYRMDDAHGRRVAEVACSLLRDLTGSKIKCGESREADSMTWAARIREIGSFIAHDNAHKHGAYILANADLPGFSALEQQELALFVLAQSGGLKKVRLQNPTIGQWQRILCLRIAVILQRRRDGRQTPIVLRSLPGDPHQGWVLALPAEWAEQHPLTDQSLRDEIEEWQRIDAFKEVSYVLIGGEKISGAGHA